MPTISNAICNETVRANTIHEINSNGLANFCKTANNIFSIVFKDDNGNNRIADVKISVRKLDEENDAQTLFEMDVDGYTAELEAKAAKAAEKKAEKEKKIARDTAERKRRKEEREAARKAKEEKGE